MQTVTRRGGVATLVSDKINCYKTQRRTLNIDKMVNS